MARKRHSNWWLRSPNNNNANNARNVNNDGNINNNNVNNTNNGLLPDFSTAIIGVMLGKYLTSVTNIEKGILSFLTNGKANLTAGDDDTFIIDTSSGF